MYLMAKNKKIIGLTGPIGAGKNAVAKILRRRGALVLDADKIAHTLYRYRSPVWHKLRKVFGPAVIGRNGRINRKKLGTIVFSDKRRLKQLDKIVHPYLKKVLLRSIRSSKRRIVVINAAVLKEIGLLDQVDEVWLVTAARKIRAKRLLKSGLTQKDTMARISSQMSDKEYLRFADLVIRNNGTPASLRKNVIKAVARGL
jgi:dephospho-CoA kinase